MNPKTPFILKTLFFNQYWTVPNSDKKIYLTFDDGPIPEVTPWVLSILAQFKIRATFFCIGDNIHKHPEVFSMVVAAGHQVGNHTFNHLKGWKVDTINYIENVQKAQRYIDKYADSNSRLFRPPYGKIKPLQSYELRKLGFKIIMWDVLSLDFDKKLNPEECVKNVLENVCSGSIIVFHDSLKAFDNLFSSLPIVIESLLKKGYTFDVLS